MSDYYLPASPSWYCSRASDCYKDTFIFGAKRSIFLVKIISNPPQILGSISAHQDRVVGVSLRKDPFDPDRLECCSAGEDGKVRVWDLASRTLQNEHSDHQHKLTCVHWSSQNLRLVASGDERGNVVVWDIHTGDRRRSCPDQGHIFCLEWSPHVPDYLAIGYRSGNILVVDTERGGTIVERLRGHNDEVHSISWCPVAGEDIHMTYAGEDDDNPFADTPPDGYGTGYLLASGSRDRTLRVWSLYKGKAVQVHKLPTNTGHKFERYDNTRNRAWVTICWIPNRPRQLLSSGHGGEMMLWDLCEPGRTKWRSLGPGPRAKGHQRIVFNISVGGDFNNTACSISMDRQVVLWDLSRLEAQCAIPTMGGFVYSIRPSPLNPGRLAVGVGDNMLRVWNYSSPNNPYDYSLFWQGIKSKVTTLAWHPEKEGLLAYGTDDGRVGIYDVLSSKAPQISSTYHRATVFGVAWGPMCPAKGPQAAIALYSCGDGQILIHDRHRLDDEAKNFNDLVAETNGNQSFPIRSTVCWKPDRSVVAVGNEDGSIEVFRAQDLRVMCCIRVHRKLINRCCWHPEFTAEFWESSQSQFWLASASNDCCVSVVNLQKVIEGYNENASLPIITEAFRLLLGHSDRVTDLAWSPHREAMLVSTSFDGSAQVWNVQAGEGIANFRGHSGRVLSVAWNDLDPDIVYSGSEDFSLQAWSIAGQENKMPPKGKERKKKKKKGGPSEDAPDSSVPIINPSQGNVKPDSKTEQELLQELLEQKRQELLRQQNGEEAPSTSGGGDIKPVPVEPPVGETANQDSVPSVQASTGKSKELTDSAREEDLKQKLSEAADDVAESLSKLVTSVESVSVTASEASPPRPSNNTAPRKEGKKWKTRSLLPLFSAKENRGKTYQQEDCSHLATYLKKAKLKSLPEDDSHLGLYMNRLCLRPHVQQEWEHHHKLGNQEQEVLLELWKGNPGPPIRQAAEAGQLNDWLLGIASMASVPLWEEMCVKYAKQLEREGSYHRAASYLLAVHKMSEAVDLLARNRLFKDALCLAQLRLHPEDTQTAEVALQWAASLGREGNHEQAAKCYLAASQPLEAARQLARRTDPPALKTATHITLVAGELEAAKDYGSRYIQQCMLNHDWYAAAEVIHWHEAFKPLCLRLCVHELMLREFHAMGLYEPESDSTWCHSEMPKDDRDVLPKFIVDPLERGSLVLWEPHQMDGRTFMHEVLSRWHTQWQVEFDKNAMQAHFVELHRLWETKQAQTSQDKVLLASSLEVTLGLLCLLRCDLDSTAHWWTVGMATCHEASHTNLLQGIARLLLPMGPGQLGRLQQEATAIRLAVCRDARGTGPAKDRKPSLPASCMPTPMLWGDQSKAVSNDTRSCTSVDCLAACYYLAVVQHLVANPGDAKLDDDADSQNGSVTDTELNGMQNGTDACHDTLSEVSNGKELSDAAEKASLESPESTKAVVIIVDSAEDSVKPLSVSETSSLDKSLEAMHLSSYDMVPEDVTVETAAEDAPSEGEVGKSEPKAVPKYILCTGSMKILAWSLLWDLHARRNHVVASLHELQRALARVQATKSEQGTEHTLDVPDYLVAPPVIQRSLSGEYMHMKPGSPRVSPVKDMAMAKRISNSSIEEEGEWMEMRDPTIPECTTENSTGHQDEVSGSCGSSGEPAAAATAADSSMTDSSILQTRIYSKAHQIFSGLSQSGCEGMEKSDIVNNGLPTTSDEPSEHITDDVKLTYRSGYFDNDVVNGRCDDTKESKDNDITISKYSLSSSYSWRDLPIEKKYADSRATLKDLTFEQIRLNKELHNLTCQIQSCPFPDPLPSAKMLITLSHQLSADLDFCRCLATWGLKHSITAEHREYFSTHAGINLEDLVA